MVNGPVIDIHVTGIKELDDFLRSLPVNIAKRGARVATKKVAQMVLEDARRIAPTKTGALRDSLRVTKKHKDPKYGDAEAGHAVTVGQGLFRGDQFYAGMLEFGTAPRWQKRKLSERHLGTKTRGRYTGMIDHNKWQFIRKALYQNRQKKHTLFVAEIRRWIEGYTRRQYRQSFAGRTERIQARLNKRIVAFKKSRLPVKKPARKRARK